MSEDSMDGRRLLNRRSLLAQAAGTVAAVVAERAWPQSTPQPWAEAFQSGAEASQNAAEASQTASAPLFKTSDAAWQRTYDAALNVLRGNVRVLPRFPRPVLIEGAVYAGIWMECGPNEALVYRRFRPDVARHSHEVFFALQRPDGQFPSNNKMNEAGFGQIQMVVPIAATAWETARATGDEAFLAQAYKACTAWDAWLMRYRNTRGTGMIEGFCTYDTGHDNSPRWKGIPNRCPDSDARKYPNLPGMPRVCPDLSATVYGARVALSAMAAALGKSAESAAWADRAESLRKLILERLYVPEDGAFYDLDANGRFVRVRSDVISRVCGEHVLDQRTFDAVWERQLHNPKAFWAPYPLPSIAMDDPAFVRPIPRNSWGGATQALTALRAPRWMEHYGRAAEFATMMQRWCEAIVRDGTFRQQMDPETGVFTSVDPGGYSPCALVMMEYIWRLAGIVEDNGVLGWNVRPGVAASREARFAMRTDTGRNAEMRYDARGATLALNGRNLARMEGTARVVCDANGRPAELVGISEQVQDVRWIPAHGHARDVVLKANQRLRLTVSAAH